MPHPTIIQGGMGVAVSAWRLARAVSMAGQLGVVSGTALAIILSRRLQLGDLDGQMRRALASLPIAGVAQRVLDAWYIPGGKAAEAPFKLPAMPLANFGQPLTELTIAANFAEVFLAKEGHAGLVGINFLEKLQMPALPSLYGAMLAGVDYILMGAGIPRSIPGVLDQLAAGQATSLNLDAQGMGAGEHLVAHFDPADFGGSNGSKIRSLKRPNFLAIVSSAVLAATLARKSNGRVDGFVIETSVAGGHNAPPRGPLRLNERGEPIYGERDEPDMAKYRELGLPFWMAGSYGLVGGLARARAVGATGIQVGTAFAICEESGLRPELKQQIIQSIRDGKADVRTDPLASPTGFPFKVFEMEGTMSEADAYADRQRICDIGYLRTIYRKADGTTGYRCAAEPTDDYVRKGGNAEETVGRKCICNCLLSAAGFAQTQRDGRTELALVTAGDEIRDVVRFLLPGKDSYAATDVVKALLAETPADVLTAPTV